MGSPRELQFKALIAVTADLFGMHDQIGFTTAKRKGINPETLGRRGREQDLLGTLVISE